MQDAQARQLSGVTAEALDHFEQGVRAFTLAYGDAVSLFDAAIRTAP